MKHILLALSIILSTLVISGVYFFVQEKALKNTAIDDCLHTSVYRSEKEENGFTITTEEPIEKSVQACLMLKGY